MQLGTGFSVAAIGAGVPANSIACVHSALGSLPGLSGLNPAGRGRGGLPEGRRNGERRARQPRCQRRRAARGPREGRRARARRGCHRTCNRAARSSGQGRSCACGSAVAEWRACGQRRQAQVQRDGCGGPNLALGVVLAVCLCRRVGSTAPSERVPFCPLRCGVSRLADVFVYLH